MRVIRNRWFKLVIFLISLAIVVTAPSSLYEMWQRRDILRQRQVVRDSLAAKNEALKRELAEAETPEYVEKVARENLGLIKEGETIILMPRTQNVRSNDQINTQEIANWKKWWRLFF